MEAVHAVFRGEAAETVARLTRDLLSLEVTSEAATRARLSEDVRSSLHSLKGSAAMMGLAEVAALMHQIEDDFGAGAGLSDLSALVSGVLEGL
ncbi:MAG: Hpt domain-containing protein, partial [Deltaproteobacteria bacterium]|nr:Hpt domain-containing protein [Deltaproteobacteria bacterium]